MNWKERLLNLLPWQQKEKPEDLADNTTTPEHLPYKTTQPVDSELSSGRQAPAPYSPPSTLLDGPTEPFTIPPGLPKELEILQIIQQAAQNGVTELDLSDRKMTTLRPEIGQLINLTKLNLKRNELSTLPAEIGLLTNLRELYLGNREQWNSGNKLRDLPASICSLKNLTILDLSNNQFSTLPTEIGQLTSLRKLFLSENKLNTLPAEIGQLTNLTTLNLRENQISTLPAEIGQLTNLRELNLGYQEEWGSGISYLPASICSLKNLTILDLSYNQFSTLPAEIGQLTHLTILHLESNQLSSLPPEIGRLTRLRELFLYNNKLSSLPAEIGQLSNLVTLSLYNNQISSLPTEIEQLSNLKTLLLYNNKLSSLPTEIAQLINLTTLNLGNNQLSTLPAEIGQLTNLATLFLSQNICSECGGFTMPGQAFCEHCGISLRLAGSESQGNQLSTLPPEMGQLTNLKRLDLCDNPLPIPPEILSRIDEPTTILDYYFRSKHPLNEAKLVLVGQGRVGKTSLVKRLVEDQFDPDERITEGIAIKDWKVTVNEAEIKLNIWDFGGQEIMHATHQFFLTLRSLYVLVLDVQQDEGSNRLAYWFKMIESFGANSPIIVVSNQIDQRRELFLNRGELVKKYPNIKAFVETSCQSGEGIAKLKAQITAQIDVLAHVRDEIPIQWLRIKSELESLRKDYVAYDEYVALCHTNGIDQEQEQRILIQLLHDLGVVLNFPDPRLRETNVLNPSWVTGGVYQIIHAQAILQRQGIREMGQLGKGILEVGQLDQILDKKRYPREKHLFIMDMMRKFELCFDLDGHLRERFLIPDLLPEAEPALSFHVDSFNMQLQYEFLPQSVISRLMVRMNRDIFEDTYWRHGMVLVHNANRAIIKALPKRKKIIISITGEPKSRQAFWQRINKELNEIRRHIRRLTWKPQVPIYKRPECTACRKIPTRFAARFCSQCGQKFHKYDEQPCLNCEFPNPVAAKLCFKCGVGLWPLPVAMIDYSELYDLQQKGIETHYVKGKDGLVKIHVGELLGEERSAAKADEPKRVTNLKSALEPLRLRVHPQKFYELTFLLGRLYYEEVGDHSYARAALEDGHHAIEALRRLTQNERAQVDLSAESVKLYDLIFVQTGRFSTIIPKNGRLCTEKKL